MNDVLLVLLQLINLYKLLLIARILLTWLPNINWYSQPFKFLADITDPVMEPFRRLIPPLGGIDFSPILLFIVLDLVSRVLASSLGG